MALLFQAVERISTVFLMEFPVKASVVGGIPLVRSLKGEALRKLTVRPLESDPLLGALRCILSFERKLVV